METNVIIEEMLNKNPLFVFSIYTQIQSTTLQALGREILACLDRGITSGSSTDEGIKCSDDVINQGYGQFWLWVPGAYEVVRTMCQAEKCFSPPVAEELKTLKAKLAALRMPFAKQELPDKKNVPVRAEPSISGIGVMPPDLMFEVEGRKLSARELIHEFATIFGRITRADVLADHRDTYPA